MDKLKLLLVSVASIGQIIGIILLFINIKIALAVYIVYGIAILTLIILLLKDRWKEKKEDDKNDYRNY
jgi:hypothetical protein